MATWFRRPFGLTVLGLNLNIYTLDSSEIINFSKFTNQNLSGLLKDWMGNLVFGNAQNPLEAVGALHYLPIDLNDWLGVVPGAPPAGQHPAPIVMNGTVCTYDTDQATDIPCTGGLVNAPTPPVLALGEIEVTAPNAGTKYAYLDYEPYRTLRLYLPYCGTINLPTDLCVGKTLRIIYTVDPLNGDCNATVLVGGVGTVGGDVVAEANGNCGMNVPLSGNNVGQMKFTAAKGMAQSSVGVLKALAGAMTENPFMVTQGVGDITGGVGSLGSLIGGERSSVMGLGDSMTKFYAPQKPILFDERHDVVTPAGDGALVGYPSMKTVTLGTISGYTKVSDVHVEGLTSAYESEKRKIEQLLKEGVIL